MFTFYFDHSRYSAAYWSPILLFITGEYLTNGKSFELTNSLEFCKRYSNQIGIRAQGRTINLRKIGI